MKLDVKYTGQITTAKYARKVIKGTEDEKQYKRVGVIKVEFEFQDGDLDNFVDPSIADDRTYDSCSWGERIGWYELDINDVLVKGKVVQISRSNKDELEGKFSLTLETENLENVSTIANYIRDTDNPAQIEIKTVVD